MIKDEYERFKKNCQYVQNLDEKDIKIEYYKWKIDCVKKTLSSTDYKAIKYSEGLYTNEEYEPIKKQRQELRDEINKLQKELDKICNKDEEK